MKTVQARTVSGAFEPNAIGKPRAFIITFMFASNAFEMPTEHVST